MFPIYAMMGVGTAIPTVTNVQSSGGAVGDIDGGYPVTITGTGFSSGVTTFAVGGTDLTNVTIVSATSATATMPAKAAGSYAVTATNTPGTSTINGTFEFFSPAQLNLTEWHRASYTGAPWVGNASSGTSASRDATLGVNPGNLAPTSGAAVNGRTPALFTRSQKQDLYSPVSNTTLFNTSAGTFICLAKTTTQQAPSGFNYGDGNLLTDPNNAETTAGITSSGFAACLYDGAYKRTSAIALANDTWGACEMFFDGSTLSARVNGGTASSTACGPWTPVNPSQPYMGWGYVINYFDGSILEWITSPTVISLANRNKIRSYLNTRYFPAGAQV